MVYFNCPILFLTRPSKQEINLKSEDKLIRNRIKQNRTTAAKRKNKS